MKLVTIADGTRSGRLHVASQDGARVLPVPGVQTMQDALDHWETSAPVLASTSDRVQTEGAAFDASTALAPFPRAAQWLDGSAFETHALLIQEAWGMPVTGLNDRPLMYQGMSDRFLSPTETALFPSDKDGIDFEGEFGVVLATVPMGTKAKDALNYVRLVVLINDWSLRAFGPVEMAAGFGWMHCKPATSVAPFAVTPDELGDAWRDARVCLPLTVKRNDEVFGQANGGQMKFGFDQLIEHAAYSREIAAGTILGSGTVANTNYAEVGSSCIAERRAIEQIETGNGITPFLTAGERIEMTAEHPVKGDVFGSLSQRVSVQTP